MKRIITFLLVVAGLSLQGQTTPAPTKQSAIAFQTTILDTDNLLGWRTTPGNPAFNYNALVLANYVNGKLSGVYQPLVVAGTTAQFWRGDKSWQTLDKAAVGLANVDNTSDASKPISTATQTALDAKQPLASALTSYANAADAAVRRALIGAGTSSFNGAYSSLTGLPTIPAQFAPVAGTNITLSGTYPNITINATGGGTFDVDALTAGTNTDLGSTDTMLFSDGGTEKKYTLAEFLTWFQAQNLAFANFSTTNFLVSGWNGASAPLPDALVPASVMRDSEAAGLYEPIIAAGTTAQYRRGDETWQTLDKTAVGLANVDNTSDANKPVSTATQTALDAKVADAINNGTTTVAPSQNAVFDALALKADSSALSAKQDTLVSGTNIKTVNGTTLLGSGNIAISGGSTDPTTTVTFFDEFLTSGSNFATGGTTAPYLLTASGTGTEAWQSATSSPGHPGVAAVTTGTTAGGREVASLGVQTSSSVQNIRFGGGVMTFEMLIYLAALSNASEEYAVTLGFTDGITGTAAGDGAYFLYDRAVTGANWQRVTAASSTRTTTDTTVAVSTGWTKLKVVVNADGTSVEYFINGVSAGTNTTNIPTTAGQETGVSFGIFKSVGTTQVELAADYLLFTQTLTTAR